MYLEDYILENDCLHKSYYNFKINKIICSKQFVDMSSHKGEGVS